jgi:hypothetical protein
MIARKDLELFRIVDTVEEAMTYITPILEASLENGDG